ncbi:MAG TPA: T9SS type A sorting domain-containing protein [Bacteroidia bacterium]|nr:T9SS type A sorting domain-containing protein [Bacteroidia bacterium]
MKGITLVLTIVNLCLLFSNSFAQSVYKCNGTNVNIRAANCTSATSFGQVNDPHSFVVINTTGSNCGYTWYEFDIPNAHGQAGYPTTAFVATNFFGISSTPNNYLIVQPSAINGVLIKNSANGSQTWIYNTGYAYQWASFEPNQKLARTTSSPQVINGDNWYEVYLTPNCYTSSGGTTQKLTGWVSDGMTSGGPYLIAPGGCTSPIATVNNSSGNPNVTLTCITSGGSGGSVLYKWYSGTSCSGIPIGTNSTYLTTVSGNYACKAYISGFESTCFSCDYGMATITSSCSSPTSNVNDNTGTGSVLMTCIATGGSGGSYAYKWYAGTSCTGTALGANASFTATVSGNYACKVYINGFESTCNDCDYGYATVNTLPPSVNDITFINQVSNIPALAQPLTLYAGSPFATSNPVKICADGSAATRIRVFATDISTINLRLLNENGQIQNDIEKYGYFDTPTVIGTNELEFVYHHPTYMELSQLKRECSLQIIYNGNTPISGINFPIHIYRAPLMMVHGLWGDRDAFKEFEMELLVTNLYPGNVFSNDVNYQTNFLTLRLDYKSTNDVYFNQNRFVIINGRTDLFYKARQNYFSCGKLVVIAHSMGGVLARLYLQSSNYKGEIQKLLTVNTPHYGSQMANYLNWPDGNIGWPDNDQVRTMLFLTGRNPYKGAIEDLRVNSTAISNLNIPTAIQNKVPSNLISTNQDENILESNGGCRAVIFAAANAYSVHDIFNGEENDNIVDVHSQESSFQISNTDYSDQCHMGASSNPSILGVLTDLINSSPIDLSKFTMDGFEPGLINEPQPNPATINVSLPIQYSMPLLDSVTFQFPSNYQSFNAGDTIAVSVQGHGNVNKILFGAGNNFIEPEFHDSITAHLTYSYIIPQEAIGIVNLVSLGGDTLNYTCLDSIKINVNTNAYIDSIFAEPNVLELTVGLIAKLNIKGIFSDGIIRDISYDPNLQISLDTNLAQHLGQGFIIGKNQGDSILNLSYNGVTAFVPIHIYSDTSIFIAGIGANNTSICANGIVEFINQSTVASNVMWQFPGGIPSTSTLPNPSIVYNTPGIYDVTLIATFPGKIDTLTIPNYITVVGNPASSITPLSSTTFCSGNSVIIQTDTGSTNTYSWLKDGIEIQGASSDSYTATTGGNYQVIVTNNSGCSSTSSFLPVTVHSLPQAVATPLSSTYFCAGGSVVLNANTGLGLTYQWTKYGNAINGATTSSYTASTTGSYKVRVTDSNGCSKNSAPVLVTSISAPPASITPAGTTTICAGSSLALNANVGTGYTYKWYRYSNVVDSTSGSTYLATSAGKYRVLVTDSNGCFRKSQPVEIFVVPKPAASITASGATTFCAGGNVTLSANQGSGLTYQWYKYSNPLNGATASTYQATATGNYKVEVTNSSGCKKKSNPILVTVLPLPTATITPSVDTGFCTGDSVLLSTGTGTGYTYQWKRYGNNISGATNQTYYASMAGAYKVTITGPNGCTRNSPTIIVSGPPSATITVNGSSSICPPDSVELVAPIGNAYSYQWKENNIDILGETAQSLWVKDSGQYSVTVTNGFNCSRVSVVTTISQLCPAISFQRQVNNAFALTDAFQNVDQGYTITGLYNNISNQTGDALIIKTDAHGVSQGNAHNWTTGTIYSWNILPTNGGGTSSAGQLIYNAGINSYTGGILMHANSAGVIANGFLIKDPNFVNPAYQATFNKVINMTSNANLVCGKLYFPATFEYKAMVAKIGSSGSLDWINNFGTIDGYSSSISDIIQFNNEIVAIGTVEQYDAGNGFYDGFLFLKYDTLGNLLENKAHFNISDQIGGGSIVKSIEGGYMVMGTYNNKFALMKLGANGSLTWSKWISNPISISSSYERGEIVQADNGDYVISFSGNVSGYGSQILLIRTTSTGVLIWSKAYGDVLTDEHASSLTKCQDGGYFISGHILDSGTQTGYIVKVDSTGNSGCNQLNISSTLTNLNLQTNNPGIISNEGDLANFTSLNSGTLTSSELAICISPRLVNSDSNNNLAIYPNPTSGSFTLELHVEKSFNTNLEIYTIEGKLAGGTRSLRLTPEESTYLVDVKNLNDGIYLGALQIGAKKYYFKFVVAR